MVVNWNRRKYTAEEFEAAWRSSSSLHEVATILGCNATGGGYRTLRDGARALGLEYSDMAEGTKSKYANTLRRDLSDILVRDSDYGGGTDNLRKRLVREGLLKLECSAPFCPFRGTEVLDPFSGEARNLRWCLDHVNGKNNDNRLENLRILCYHCHSMTSTFGNTGRKITKETGGLSVPEAQDLPTVLEKVRLLQSAPRVPKQTRICACGSSKSYNSKVCATCSAKEQETISWPDTDTLLDSVVTSGFSKISRELGVSANAVKKRLKSRGFSVYKAGSSYYLDQPIVEDN